MGGLWVNHVPQEIADAIAAGNGPGVPNNNGTPAPGTILPGHIVEMNSAGNIVLGSSPDLTAEFQKLFFVVHEGDDDFSGSFAGKIPTVHGGIRFDTELWNAGAFAPRLPVIAVAGRVQLKGAFGDNIQAIGYVGPRGLVDGVLDVIAPQGVK
jgi:hypothetical protein